MFEARHVLVVSMTLVFHLLLNIFVNIVYGLMDLFTITYSILVNSQIFSTQKCSKFIMQSRKSLILSRYTLHNEYLTNISRFITTIDIPLFDSFEPRS